MRNIYILLRCTANAEFFCKLNLRLISDSVDLWVFGIRDLGGKKLYYSLQPITLLQMAWLRSLMVPFRSKIHSVILTGNRTPMT